MYDILSLCSPVRLSEHKIIYMSNMQRHNVILHFMMQKKPRTNDDALYTMKVA